MKRRFLVFFLVLALVGLVVVPTVSSSPLLSRHTSFVKPVAAQEYWGSVNSNKFHYPYCSAAKRIKPGNLRVFKSRREAVNAGYIPCKICKP